MAITATMFGIDQVIPMAGGHVTIGALVAISGSELENGAILESMQLDIDLTQTTNQIQSALAAGIRAAILAQFNVTIPANGINVMSFTKG